MTFVRPPIEPEGPDNGTLEWRASLGFKALAAVNGFAIILAFFPPVVPAARLVTVSFNIGSLLLVVLLVIEARGLDRLHPWAIAAVRPLLVVIGLAGVYVFVTTILGGKIRIPLDTGVAIWALHGPAYVTPRPKLAGRSLPLIAASVGFTAVMLFSRPLFDWGGAIDVRPADLHASMSVDCGVAAADGTVPSAITITYDWSWTATSPLPDGLDAIVVGWTGDDAEGRPLYLLDVTPDTERGVYSGRRGYPSRDMTDEVAHESRGWWHWGVELVERGYAPGHLIVQLRRAQTATPDASPLVIKGTYVHVGIWRQDVQPVTCTW